MSTLAPHQQRVVTERDELAERLAKLFAFFQSPIFAGLPAAEQTRLRNLGNQCEEAASEICSLRAALTQKRAEYEDLKQTMHNMARNHALQLEAARKREPESVPELRAQLQTLGLWIAEALPTEGAGPINAGTPCGDEPCTINGLRQQLRRTAAA